jgi:hypothetical protein
MLAKFGETVTLRRTVVNQPAREITITAFCRGYKASELIGGIIQGDSLVVLSPTELHASDWPIPPKVNDKITFGGRLRNIQTCAPVTIRSEIVRYDLTVRG